MCSDGIPSLIEKLENDGFNMLTWMATVPLLHSSIYS
jgi:hypothetical protein